VLPQYLSRRLRRRLVVPAGHPGRARSRVDGVQKQSEFFTNPSQTGKPHDLTNNPRSSPWITNRDGTTWTKRGREAEMETEIVKGASKMSQHGSEFSVHCFLVAVKCWPPAPTQALAINQLLCPLQGS